jgi:ribosomal protein S18 acetylase RimI-like enzyme
MNLRSVNLRPANPTEKDGLVFAKYLDEAAEGFFRFMLGRKATQIITKAFIQPDHNLSYQNVHFAEHNNDIVGMVSGYTLEAHHRSTLKPLEHAAGPWNLRMRIAQFLFSPLMRIIDSIAASDFYVQAIAVDKELRGSGVGSLLMNFLEQQAIAKGAARLALDVSAKNENARHFYEQRGMTIESQWPRHLNIQSLKFYRMTKDLK